METKRINYIPHQAPININVGFFFVVAIVMFFIGRKFGWPVYVIWIILVCPIVYSAFQFSPFLGIIFTGAAVFGFRTFQSYLQINVEVDLEHSTNQSTLRATFTRFRSVVGVFQAFFAFFSILFMIGTHMQVMAPGDCFHENNPAYTLTKGCYPWFPQGLLRMFASLFGIFGVAFVGVVSLCMGSDEIRFTSLVFFVFIRGFILIMDLTTIWVPNDVAMMFPYSSSWLAILYANRIDWSLSVVAIVLNVLSGL